MGTPSLQNANSDILQKFSDTYKQAEDQIKIVELIDKELVIPSVNQLRYAGYHIAKGVACFDIAELNKHIEKAVNHCKRSYYDANEVAVIYYLEEIQAFQNDFGKTNAVLSVVSDYCDLLAQAQDAADHIEEIKKTHFEDRDDFYTSCDPHYQNLKQIVNKLSVARPHIVNAMAADRRKVQKVVLTIVLSCLGLVVAIVSAILKFLSMK